MPISTVRGKPHLVKRTFEALKHPPGSAERSRLNCNQVTSEYMPSQKYIVFWCVASNHSPRLQTVEFNRSFRRKRDAEAFLANLLDGYAY